MAMFHSSAQRYMPFMTGNNVLGTKNKRTKLHVNGGKLHKLDSNRKHSVPLATHKMYQITLKDKKGNIYKCIVKTDGTHSLPTLCEQSVPELVSTDRFAPDVALNTNSPSKQRLALAEKLQALNSINENAEYFSTSLDLRDCGKKQGFISAIINFFKSKTRKWETKNETRKEMKSSKHKHSVKSKRKPRDASQRKRQRTVSALSNLDPIAESPNEEDFENDEDNDSYRHYSSSSSDSDSVSSNILCNIEPVSFRGQTF